MPEDRNRITDDLVAEAVKVSGRAAIGGGVAPLYWRKPVRRLGGWFIRDGGWRKIKSFYRLDRDVIFLRTEYHYYGFSREIRNCGSLPEWFDRDLMETTCHRYKPGTKRGLGLWADVETYHVSARYTSDIPEEFCHVANAA